MEQPEEEGKHQEDPGQQECHQNGLFLLVALIKTDYLFEGFGDSESDSEQNLGDGWQRDSHSTTKNDNQDYKPNNRHRMKI